MYAERAHRPRALVWSAGRSVMRSFFDIKVLLLIGLFVALVVKGGQICSAGAGQTETHLAPPSVSESLPVRPIEEEFRGVSPLPALTQRANHVRKAPRTALLRKPAKPLMAKSALPARSVASKSGPSGKPSKKS